MTTLPVVRPSQRIRNAARALRISGDRNDYLFPTTADILEEIAAAVAENEERQAEQVARIKALEELVDQMKAAKVTK